MYKTIIGVVASVLSFIYFTIPPLSGKDPGLGLWVFGGITLITWITFLIIDSFYHH